jgi:NAD(P)-dependent dehydrogenase (short-subunit alcohol dehydrogenase family)
MSYFKDKTALITGASSGIGRATALAFAEKGSKVVVSDIDETGGQETVDLIEKMGGKAIFIKANVASKEDIQNLVNQTVAKFKTLDFAINNAGIGGPYAPTAAYEDRAYDKVIAVNQTGVFYCMREELKVMQNQKSGSIVNVSSMAGKRALPNTIAYVASKHAVLGMTKTAALEYARYGIRINAVCPVFTHSKLFDGMVEANPKMIEALKKTIPMRRFGEPEDIANAIIWLCDGGSSFVTGLSLPIDGGSTA